MNREDIKIGQRVSFYYHGKRRGDRSVMSGDARMIYGVISKINRTTAEVMEIDKDGSHRWTFWRKPSDLTMEIK